MHSSSTRDPDAARAHADRLQRVHDEADAGQVGIDRAAGADDRVGELDAAGVPRRRFERADSRLAALALRRYILGSTWISIGCVVPSMARSSAVTQLMYCTSVPATGCGSGARSRGWSCRPSSPWP